MIRFIATSGGMCQVKYHHLALSLKVNLGSILQGVYSIKY